MRLRTEQRQHYCGIDLRTNKIYLCILNQAGALLPYRKTNTEPELFLKTIAPLGRGWSSALRACFHGTGDRHPKNMALLRGSLIPSAYVYPLHMRAAATLSLHNPIPC